MKDKFLIIRLILAAVVIVTVSIAVKNSILKSSKVNTSDTLSLEQQDKVLPLEGVVLPISWRDLGKKLVDSGTIDLEKFQALYKTSGEQEELIKKLLTQSFDEALVMTQNNSGVLLNILWAFGLANKNRILEEGPIMDSKYGGAGRFASTGGWTLAKGNPMNHYSKHRFIVLTEQQQELVERVSKNIYRPCCSNATYFPDCNHGMAMLGLLELMAANNVAEDKIYQIALKVNSYWFPSTYLTLSKYFESKGIAWDNIDPKEVLGYNFSSAAGYQRVLAEIEPVREQGGGSCGV